MATQGGLCVSDSNHSIRRVSHRPHSIVATYGRTDHTSPLLGHKDASQNKTLTLPSSPVRGRDRACRSEPVGETGVASTRGRQVEHIWNLNPDDFSISWVSFPLPLSSTFNERDPCYTASTQGGCHGYIVHALRFIAPNTVTCIEDNDRQVEHHGQVALRRSQFVTRTPTQT